jgi:exopolysaccharide biosynthesis polyprenyl glycosylphosphotransferase
MLFDLGMLAISYTLAAVRIWHLTEFSSFAAFISMRVKVQNILLFLGLFCFWHAIFSAFGLYRSKRLGGQREEALEILKAISAGVLALVVVAVIFRVRMVTPAFILGFWVVASALILLSRLTLRVFLRRMRVHGRNLRHMLIVGTNPRAIEFARAIHERHELGYQLLGFADEEWAGNREFAESGNSIVTDLNHIPDFLRERVVDEVVIALPLKSFYSRAARIVGECREQGIIVRTLTNMFDFQQGRVELSETDVTDATTYSAALFQGWPLVGKRLFDLCISSYLLLILAPLFVIVAVLVKCDSAGPAFFTQERLGLSKRKFRLYKFRTMVRDAHEKQAQLESLNEADGPVFKIKADPRVTRLGKFLRKASIDELPQLLNVFMGHMSLVGPRPLPLRDYQGFDQDWARRRFSVRPGLTCLWQINGRSSVSFQKWMELDLHYIDHWSFWLDMKVIAKTIPAVLKGVGAA